MPGTRSTLGIKRKLRTIEIQYEASKAYQTMMRPFIFKSLNTSLSISIYNNKKISKQTRNLQSWNNIKYISEVQPISSSTAYTSSVRQKISLNSEHEVCYKKICIFKGSENWFLRGIKKNFFLKSYNGLWPSKGYINRYVIHMCY